MKDEEDFSTFFLRVDEIVNSITGLRATIKDNSTVKNIMRTLPTRFNPKVSILEDKSDLDELTNDELYGILTTYEMRTKPDNVYRK